jgi:hypothetical protein
MRACRTIKMRAVILIQTMIWCGCWLIQGLRHSTTNSITRRCRSFSTTHRLDRHHWMSCIVAGHSTRRNVSFSTITAATTSSSSSSSTSPTRYTIVCPPTDPDTLCSIVAKHQANVNRFWSNKPIAVHTKQAFQQVQDHVFGKAPGSRTVGSGRSSSNKNDSCPLILDSGCGTGRSSIRLGALYPNSIVLGVDKSLARLSRNNNNKFVADVVNDSQSEEHHHLVQQVAGNVWLVRAELVDFWRLLLLHRQQQLATESTAATTASSLLAKESSAMSPSSFLVPPVSQHYVLYPNPYPKKARLSSRWYAHPSFPLLLLLGGERIVFRSNWKQVSALLVLFTSGHILMNFPLTLLSRPPTCILVLR